MKFKVLISGSPSIANTFTIEGEDLLSAIKDNFSSLVKKGNNDYIPYRYPITVTPRYSVGALGGRGAVELILEWMYSDHTEKPAWKHTNSVFIYANESDLDDTDTFVMDSEWGGYRPGSGRKPTGRKRQFIYVTDEEYVKVKKYIEGLRKDDKND